jgi:thiosulfate/3-mercaptopyruvate sulfurtransferase
MRGKCYQEAQSFAGLADAPRSKVTFGWYGTEMVYKTLIDAETLAAHLSDPAYVVVDCRYNVQDPGWGAREYQQRHISGAAFAHVDDDLSGAKTGHNGRHPLPELARLADTLGRLGIADGVQVVVYDQDAGMYASRLWWLLRWLGHDAVALLDGGFARWSAENRPARSGVETHPARRFTGVPRTGWLVTADEVSQAIATRQGRLVDARTPERYRGDVEPVDKVAGRIPGAVNYPYQWNVGDAGTFRSPSEIRERVGQVIGDVPLDRVVCYCGSGVTACLNLLAFEHAGLHGAKLYPGSWSEWLSDPARPIERG